MESTNLWPEGKSTNAIKSFLITMVFKIRPNTLSIRAKDTLECRIFRILDMETNPEFSSCIANIYFNRKISTKLVSIDRQRSSTREIRVFFFVIKNPSKKTIWFIEKDFLPHIIYTVFLKFICFTLHAYSSNNTFSFLKWTISILVVSESYERRSDFKEKS